MFTFIEANGVRLVQSQLLRSLPIRHGITTRIGGVSRAPYESLNMAFHTGDNADAVCENRRLACAVLGVEANQLVAGEQVHGNAYHVVTEDDAGRGAFDRASAIRDTDILLTNTPGILLASFYADCVPLLLCDPIHHVVGVAHCGWRGTELEVPKVAVEAMVKEFGTAAGDIRAVLGPSIGPCCYEVSTAIATRFRQQFGHDVALGRQLDLRLANSRTLQRVGVPAHFIHTAPWCTSCQHELFFSHRASGGHTGRIATLIGLL